MPIIRFVPEGRLIVAQQFTAGEMGRQGNLSPVGTTPLSPYIQNVTKDVRYEELSSLPENGGIPGVCATGAAGRICTSVGAAG